MGKVIIYEMGPERKRKKNINPESQKWEKSFERTCEEFDIDREQIDDLAFTNRGLRLVEKFIPILNEKETLESELNDLDPLERAFIYKFLSVASAKSGKSEK